MSWKMISLRSNLFQGVLKNIKVRSIYTGKSLRTEYKDHYEALGIKKDASQADIKKAYFELSKIYHPDRIAATDENLAKFREISVAYEVLGNEQARKLYDRGLIKEGKMGFDEPEDINDPIIKFYKQRHIQSKLKSAKGDSETMEAWTQQLYERSQKRRFDKTDLFKHKKEEIELPEFVVNKYILLLCCSFFLSLAVSYHTKDDPFREFVLNLFCGKKSD